MRKELNCRIYIRKLVMGKPKIKRNQEKLNDALRLINNGISINKAASLHKVSVSSLWRR